MQITVRGFIRLIRGGEGSLNSQKVSYPISIYVSSTKCTSVYLQSASFMETSYKLFNTLTSFDQNKIPHLTQNLNLMPYENSFLFLFLGLGDLG